MKIVILDGKTMGEDIDFGPINAIGDTEIFSSTEQAQVAQRIKDANVVIVNKVSLTRENLSECTCLGLICVFAVGFNNIDIDFCREKNIRVRNVPGYCTQSVCQHTFALLFALLEQLRYYDDFVKSGAYSESGVANHIGRPFCEISGMNWGIIGMGAIGRSVADIAAAFGAKVCYSSISGTVRKEKYKSVTLETLLRESDIISVHAPLNEQTHNLLGEKEFQLMKKTALFINVGRGAITDEAALASAVDNGMIKGAAIDVFSSEPPEKTNPLIGISHRERVVYTPHIAWASVQARERCISMTAENIRSYLCGKAHNDVWSD